ASILVRMLSPLDRATYSVRLAVFGKRLKAGLSVHERPIDEPFEHLAVIRADRAWRLAHVDADDLFLGIDPEISAGVTSSHASARRARHAGNAVALAHGKAKPERIAGRSQQKLARLERRCAARAKMVRRHRFDG